jgi:hypothetical protein
MNVDRIVHTVAGTMIVASLALARYHSPYWHLLTLFVGVNLFQSGLTNWCLMSTLLAKAGVKTQGACGF